MRTRPRREPVHALPLAVLAGVVTLVLIAAGGRGAGPAAATSIPSWKGLAGGLAPGGAGGGAGGGRGCASAPPDAARAAGGVGGGGAPRRRASRSGSGTRPPWRR